MSTSTRKGIEPLDTIKKSLSMVVSKEGISLTAIGTLASFALTGVPVDPLALMGTLTTAVKSGALLNVGGTATIRFLESRAERSKLDLTLDSCIRYIQRLRSL